MFYSYKLTPNGICFCTSATFYSLGMGLEDFHFPKVDKKQHVLFLGSGAVLRCGPLLVFLRARGREAQCPGELHMCDSLDLNCLCRCHDTGSFRWPHVLCGCFIFGGLRLCLHYAVGITWQWEYSCGVILLSPNSIKRKPKPVSCHCAQRWWKWGFDDHRFLVQVLFLHRIPHVCVVPQTRIPVKSLGLLVLWDFFAIRMFPLLYIY